MEWIKLNRKKQKEKPLFVQVTDSLRDAIRSGKLEAGYKLPSSRDLAEQLNVSRNIVIIAYEQLAIEGYLEAKPGAGNYIAQGARWYKEPESLLPVKKTETAKSNKNKTTIDFKPGIPAISLFPRRLWGKLAREACLSMSPADLSYTSPAGSLQLKNALVKHLHIYRGINSVTDSIVITSGAAQAFYCLAQIFKTRVPEIVMEEPCTQGVRDDFIRAGLKIIPIKVDECGLDTSLLPKANCKRIIFVTPSHQFPLGGVLSIQRRLQLIDFAKKSDSFIIEDDYDSEFRYVGSPLPTLQELAPEHVIHVGTFSKMLFPGLRLAYVILPSVLIDSFRQEKGGLDLQCSIMDQLTLSRFIEEGHLRRHILKMKKVYSQRRKVLIKSLETYFGQEVKILGDATGLHVLAEFTRVKFDAKLRSYLEKQGLLVYTPQEHAFAGGQHDNQLILGYGDLSSEEIEKGVKQLNHCCQ